MSYGQAETLTSGTMIETLSRMPDQQIFELIMQLVRNPSLVREAINQKLSAPHFTSGEVRYAVVWTACKQLVEARREFDYMSLRGYVEDYLTSGTLAVSAHEAGWILQPDAGGFLYHLCFANQYGQLSFARGMELLKRFLHERKVWDEAQRFLRNTGGDQPADLGTILKTLATSYEVIQQTAAASPHIQAIPTELTFTFRATTPTTITWFDRYCGGLANKETYLLLGSYGSGKSLLATMLLVKCSQRAAAVAPSAEEMLHWYLFSYELNQDQLQERITSYAAQISSTTLRELSRTRDWSVLSTATTLRPYERERFSVELAASGQCAGEWDRYQESLALNYNCHPMDMSGKMPGLQMVGVGGLAEIEALLSREVNDYGRKIGGVIIDFADAVIDRQISRQGVDRDRVLRHLVGAAFGQQCSTDIAGKYNCPVVFLKQLDAKGNALTKGLVPTLGMSANAKDAGMYVDYALGIARKCEETHCTRFGNASKTRFSSSVEPILLRVRGEFGMLEETTDFVYSPTRRMFLPAEEAGTFFGAEAGDGPAGAPPVTERQSPDIPPMVGAPPSWTQPQARRRVNP